MSDERRAELEAAARKAAMEFILRDEISEICNGRITKVMLSGLAALLVDFGLAAQQEAIEDAAAIADRIAAHWKKHCSYDGEECGQDIAFEIRALLPGEGAGKGKETK